MEGVDGGSGGRIGSGCRVMRWLVSLSLVPSSNLGCLNLAPSSDEAGRSLPGCAFLDVSKVAELVIGERKIPHGAIASSDAYMLWRLKSLKCAPPILYSQSAQSRHCTCSAVPTLHTKHLFYSSSSISSDRGLPVVL